MLQSKDDYVDVDYELNFLGKYLGHQGPRCKMLKGAKDCRGEAN